MPKLRAAVGAAFDLHARISESSMRSNARWTDRTGNARNGLRAEHVARPTEDALVLFHTMPYGVWLEIRWSGRYAIIVTTMQQQVGEIAVTLGQLLNRMGA